MWVNRTGNVLSNYWPQHHVMPKVYLCPISCHKPSEPGEFTPPSSDIFQRLNIDLLVCSHILCLLKPSKALPLMCITSKPFPQKGTIKENFLPLAHQFFTWWNKFGHLSSSCSHKALDFCPRLIFSTWWQIKEKMHNYVIWSRQFSVVDKPNWWALFELLKFVWFWSEGNYCLRKHFRIISVSSGNPALVKYNLVIICKKYIYI